MTQSLTKGTQKKKNEKSFSVNESEETNAKKRAEKNYSICDKIRINSIRQFVQNGMKKNKQKQRKKNDLTKMLK